jgi:ubiquinol-cytochrome c reductase cytochrome c subunit
MTLSGLSVIGGALLTAALAGSATAGQSAPSPAPAAAQAPAGNAANGRKLFASVGCYQCHGYEAQGSTATGPRLGPRPLPYAALSRYVRRPTGQMPPYTAKVVPDADLADIYAFLQSLPAAAAAPALLK